jgi:hypothetical protein
MDTKLFAGKPEMLGGLSNEDELAKLCPGEFKRDNPWSDYSRKVFFLGANISNWKWKSANPNIRKHQHACWYGLLGTFGLSRENKEAVAGWMLSEMLSEVPQHIAKPEDAQYVHS